ncbi:MAG: LytR/AlgR family response regulator transcription factor [Candidatus Coproplasma sp.]
MSTLRVCICDDDLPSLTVYAAAVKASFNKYGEAAEVDTYNCVASLRNRMDKISYDIIFLDIDMPGEDGITFAKSLRKVDNSVPVVFVTAREDRMFDTFAVRPFGFVRKCVFLDDLNEAVRLFLEAKPDLVADMIMFSTSSGGFQVNAKQIIYIESNLHTQCVYLNDKNKFELRLGMDSLEKLLAEKRFIRIHKGYIVNYRYIKRIDNTEVYLTTGQVLPLSRSKKKEVKALWLEYGTKNGFINIDG